MAILLLVLLIALVLLGIKAFRLSKRLDAQEKRVEIASNKVSLTMMCLKSTCTSR